MASDDSDSRRQISAGFVILAIVAILLVVFILQNTQRVPVELFFWEFTGQMWVVLLGTAVVTLVLAEVASILRKRRR